MQRNTGLRRPGVAAGSLLVMAALLGCGNAYRPVITPVNPTGPPQQGTAYVTVVSAFTPTSAGVGTIVDFSGDSIAAQIGLGTTPRGFTQNFNGSQALTINTDGTLNGFSISPSVQTKSVSTSTLGNVGPYNALSTASSYYIVERSAIPHNAVGLLTGSPISLKVDIPVADGLVTLVGRSGSQRFYALSQGILGQGCNSPGSVTVSGFASGIETVSSAPSSVLGVGICPVYGVGSADTLRVYVLNRGGSGPANPGTVTVIDSQKNVLDMQNGGKNTTITTGAGPVYAELFDTSSQLVTANYDGNSISVIDVSTDVFDNDSPQFGTVHTIPVGSHPTQVTVLQDGSRAYVANSGDGTVSVVDLSSFKVEKTIPVAGTPRLISSIYSTPNGKVYVSSPDISSLTVIRTDTDTIEATVPVQGNLIDVRVNRQNIAQGGQAINVSYLPGAGVPCTTGTACPAPTDATY